jgi:hypothetical protein
MRQVSEPREHVRFPPRSGFNNSPAPPKIMASRSRGGWTWGLLQRAWASVNSNEQKSQGTAVTRVTFTTKSSSKQVKTKTVSGPKRCDASSVLGVDEVLHCHNHASTSRAAGKKRRSVAHARDASTRRHPELNLRVEWEPLVRDVGFEPCATVFRSTGNCRRDVSTATQYSGEDSGCKARVAIV